MASHRLRYGTIAILVFLAEVYIAARLPHLNFVRGSLGDVLVVVLLYAFALSLREFDRVRLAAAAFGVGCVVEACQYFGLARWLGLRPHGVLFITLGSVATWGDVLCYLAGAALALSLDLALFGRPADAESR